jgi:hypothetical protein
MFGMLPEQFAAFLHCAAVEVEPARAFHKALHCGVDRRPRDITRNLKDRAEHHHVRRASVA